MSVPAIATHAHLPALGEHERREAGHLLQATLIELLDLVLAGKHLHWNVAGRGFQSMHLRLDELVAAWLDLADVVAERAVAVGHAADGRPEAIAQGSGRRPVDEGPVSVEDAIRAVVGGLAVSAQEVRGRVERLGQIEPVSQDVLLGVLRALETHRWTMRSEL